MKILLLVPASGHCTNIVRDVLYGCWCKGKRIGGGTVPPLNLLTIATILKNDGHEVVFLDALNERLDFSAVRQAALDCGSIILLTSTMSIKEDAEVLRLIKESNKNIMSIICGSHPTFMPDFCLGYENVDIAVRGEPDFSIREVVKGLSKNDGSWKKVYGIAYRQHGDIKINADYPLMDDLNALPIADRSLLPGKVAYFNPLIKKYPYTTAVTSRGCPGRCSFCTVPFFYGGKIRAWPVDKVIEEIRYLIGLGYREIYYRDETFTFSKKRTIEICEKIIRGRLKFNWLCNVRVGTADEETLSLMKRAGCRLIKVGVESGAQRILDTSGKGIKIEQTQELFNKAKDARILTHAHLMFGMPGEDRESLQETASFIKKINPDTVDIGICTPYPGSALFNRMLGEYPGLASDIRLDFGNLHSRAFYNKRYTSLDEKELEGWLTVVYRRFYLRPSYLLKSLLRIRSFSGLVRLCSAGIKVIQFSIFGEKSDVKA